MREYSGSKTVKFEVPSRSNIEILIEDLGSLPPDLLVGKKEPAAAVVEDEFRQTHFFGGD